MVDKPSPVSRQRYDRADACQSRPRPHGFNARLMDFSLVAAARTTRAPLRPGRACRAGLPPVTEGRPAVTERDLRQVLKTLVWSEQRSGGQPFEPCSSKLRLLETRPSSRSLPRASSMVSSPGSTCAISRRSCRAKRVAASANSRPWSGQDGQLVRHSARTRRPISCAGAFSSVGSDTRPSYRGRVASSLMRSAGRIPFFTHLHDWARRAGTLNPSLATTR